IVIVTVLYDRVGFELPIFEKVAFSNGRRVAYLDVFKGGFFGGVISGLLLVSIAFFYSDYIPEELERFDPTILNRLVYGAFTEEIMLRFGVMTFIVWLFSLISSKKKSWIYLAGLIVSSLLFGLGHLPIVFSLTSAPTTELIFYIVFGNFVGGIVFGWLYWRKGLEAAILAHFFAHIVFILNDVLGSHSI
ncbi:MAG TPA: CPBP family intramembrane metalloprotease, partial [Candidatus Sphingobacterium stercorigallinarum]|nr:CPBP family intramembrane metalloprotease [Candidatus Sphingobacterium stercorigallinarum]